MTTTYCGDQNDGRAVSPVFSLLLRLLSANWTWGRLTLVLPDGRRHQLTGQTPGKAAILNIRDPRFAARVLKSGDIGFAEGYMAGEWDTPDLALLLETLVNNYEQIRRLFDGNPLMNLVHWVGHRLNRNSRRGSRRNIHAHYDLGNAFYGAWLDPSMTYSSARFETAGQGLQDAQRAKYASLARMMDLRPGHRVLEIGCGWGGFAEFAAREIGAMVTGVTISREQHDYARRRLFEAGLAERADIRPAARRRRDNLRERGLARPFLADHCHQPPVEGQAHLPEADRNHGQIRHGFAFNPRRRQGGRRSEHERGF
ncbi:SAM-dependent methyltransferase [Brevundimonas sp. NPDC046655]|uniref:SAM-dependent methyltransferase n=1 Tax=unclassified Brevundimonas TaxID=2622653 RepID=UPI00384DCE21